MRIANDRVQRMLATCSGWAWHFYDWCQRPTTSELRGRKLLREWLSPEQLRQYDGYKYFEVTGCHTGRRYRISHGKELNVCELDDSGRRTTGWCFVPADASLVTGDVMLAQNAKGEWGEVGITLAGLVNPTQSVPPFQELSYNSERFRPLEERPAEAEELEEVLKKNY